MTLHHFISVETYVCYFCDFAVPLKKITSPNIQPHLETMKIDSSSTPPRAQGFSKAAMQSKGALDHPVPRMNPCHGHGMF